jgi:hypothetical protein
LLSLVWIQPRGAAGGLLGRWHLAAGCYFLPRRFGGLVRVRLGKK